MFGLAKEVGFIGGQQVYCHLKFIFIAHIAD